MKSSSVTRKIESSSWAEKKTPVRPVQAKEPLAVKTDSPRVTPRSVSAKLDAPRESRQRTEAASKSVQPDSRTRTSSEKLIAADIEPRRLTASDKIVERISPDRSTRSKPERLIASDVSAAAGAPRERRQRDDQPITSPPRKGAVSGEGAKEPATVSSEVPARQPRSTTERTGTRSREQEPQIVVNNTNNVVVQGNVTERNVRPRVPRKLSRDVGSLNHDSHWDRHDSHDDHHDSHSGVYFSFAWSNFSCGRVAYFPYSYYHSWCGDPAGYYGLSYYYPGYHRRFIFVSIGGYWPSWYRYPRYYWYGCHPYYWYGPDIVYYPSGGATYNTYNYYNTNETPAAPAAASSTPYYELGNPKQAEPAQPVDEPEYQTAADLCFEHAVELFAAGNYADAIAQLREAIVQSPEDIILPFTYAQALFANGEYAMAASVLRAAIEKIPDDELTIYYPRGLYQDEKVLTEQIDKLQAAAAAEPFNADHQLLLGYQYMGIGDMNKAHGPLSAAAQSAANGPTVAKLLDLAAQLEQEAAQQ